MTRKPRCTCNDAYPKDVWRDIGKWLNVNTSYWRNPGAWFRVHSGACKKVDEYLSPDPKWRLEIG